MMPTKSGDLFQKANIIMIIIINFIKIQLALIIIYLKNCSFGVKQQSLKENPCDIKDLTEYYREPQKNNYQGKYT